MNKKKLISFLFMLLYTVYFRTMDLRKTELNASQDWELVQSEPDSLGQLQKDFATLQEKYNTLSKQHDAVLQVASKKGLPKVIKKLKAIDSLDQAQRNFIEKNGIEYAFECAILQDNLNLIKLILISQKDDLRFKADAFALAALHGKNKTTKFLAQTYPNLFNGETLSILYDIFSQAMYEASLRPIKIVLNSKQYLILKEKQWDKLINFGIDQALHFNFIKGKIFLERQKLAISANTDQLKSGPAVLSHDH